jgi:hypothetical protein
MRLRLEFEWKKRRRRSRDDRGEKALHNHFIVSCVNQRDGY